MATSTGPFVQKSYRHCSFQIRETVGRLAIARECRALKLMSSSGHAPAFLSRPDRFTVEMESIEGTPLESLRPGQVDPDKLYRQTLSLLETLKIAGLAHGDLGHDHWQDMGRESNLLWTDDERLVAIDFAGSVPLYRGFAFAKNVGLALHFHDRLLLTKVAHHFCPERLQDAEQTRWPVELWELLRIMGKL